jgi:hypothetical protein
VPVNSQQVSKPRTWFKSFQPARFSEDQTTLVDYSTKQIVRPSIKVLFIPQFTNPQKILPSNNSDFGIFLPLPYQSKGYFVISASRQLSTRDLKLKFPTHVEHYFGDEESIVQGIQLIDVECKRTESNASVVFLGECMYGSMIHPLYQFHMITHEVYSLIAFLRNAKRYPMSNCNLMIQFSKRISEI